jgi:tRNA(fMet)-specific endonuclease VapC
MHMPVLIDFLRGHGEGARRLAAMTILPFRAEEAQVAADLRQDLESRGQAIGMADFMIAAVCIANQAELLTRNVKHFERVKDLKLAAGG